MTIHIYIYRYFALDKQQLRRYTYKQVESLELHIYVWMYALSSLNSRVMDQPGMATNPARGQLEHFVFVFVFLGPRPHMTVWSRETGLTVLCSAPVCSFSTLRLNLVLTHGILPASATDGVPIHRQAAIGSVLSLSGYYVYAYRWRSLPRILRDRSSTCQGSSSNRCYCLFRYHEGLMLVHLSFPTPTSSTSGTKRQYYVQCRKYRRGAHSHQSGVKNTNNADGLVKHRRGTCQVR